MSTMALLTTTPAREITPTPVIIIPKGISITDKPRNTPPRERITVVSMIKGCVTELNCVTRIRTIKKIEARKALCCRGRRLGEASRFKNAGWWLS